MSELDKVTQRILTLRKEMPAEQAMLVGISGIDASGKGYTTDRLACCLAPSVNFAVINVDGWLNLPHFRFSGRDPGRHFYDHALRLDEMFDRLILPLKRDRSIRLTANLAEETAAKYHRFTYEFDDIDIILLEGIFLFKSQFRQHFDLKIWIDCPFETALERAMSRSQEGLSEDQTKSAYRNIYFPAQLLHLERDKPHKSADLRVNND